MTTTEATPDPAATAAGDSDADWLTRSCSDPPSFGVLFDRHAADVRGYLARRVGADLADDLVGQVFLVAFESRHRYEPSRAAVRPWLFGIATNLVRRHHRVEARGLAATARLDPRPSSVSDPTEVVAGQVDAAASVQEIAAALAGMSRGVRDALLLYAWADLGYDEIAAALGIPVGTVRSRLHSARARLRPLLDRTTTQGEK